MPVQISKDEFRILRAMVLGTDPKLELGPKDYENAFAVLHEKRFLVDGAITDAGRAALEPYRVKNAVIQAAGFASRFTPISLDVPKGLMEVRGEILVERIIRFLIEAGITDITMVVGYRKEMYEYLGEKYGIKFIENPEYVTGNTMTTYWHARHLIGNTYMCYSDHYYPENPFTLYEYESYYPSLYTDYDAEWCIEFDEDRECFTMYWGEDEPGEFMHGWSYISTRTAEIMAPWIDEGYHSEEDREKYWENVLWTGREVIPMHYPPLRAGIVNEFDRMSELAAFDPEYIYKVNSPSLDNICATLGCDRAEIHDCYSLTHNATNASCHFAVGDKEYVYFDPKGYDGSEDSDWSITPFVPEEADEQ